MTQIAEVPAEKRVYVDESGVNTCLVREYGRSLRGTKVQGVKRGRKFQRLNVIGALCNGNHLAIECYSHTTNSRFIERWFRESLVKAIPKGNTVIMDNASFHRKAKLKVEAEEAGVRVLFLPPYSPDLNPIEKTWANMKRRLRDTLPSFHSASAAIYDYFSFPIS